MDKLWSAFKLEIGSKVNDPNADNDPSGMIYAINDALLLFAAVHTGKASTFDMTGDGSTTQFSIPENCVEHEGVSYVYGVYDSTDDAWLTKVEFFPGKPMQQGFYSYPSGTLNINPAPDSGNALVGYYVAHYAQVVGDSSVISLPAWAFEAVKMYAAGRVLETQSSNFTTINNFRTKVDSGNPEHNPVLQLSKRYIDQFWDIINQHPAPLYDKL